MLSVTEYLVVVYVAVSITFEDGPIMTSQIGPITTDSESAGATHCCLCVSQCSNIRFALVQYNSMYAYTSITCRHCGYSLGPKIIPLVILHHLDCTVGVFDAGTAFVFHCDDQEQDTRLRWSVYTIHDTESAGDVWLIDHAWEFDSPR